MSIAEADTLEAVPDLSAVPLDQLAELGDTPLAHAVALYRARLKADGEPLSAFNARI